MPFTTLIVDDEPLAREGLHMFLARNPEVSDIGVANDGREAVAAIRSSRPDLVLLDVQMPEMDGFAVVREVGVECMPPVVFVTAYDRFAIQAFEINAVDYLLKPTTEERFAQTISRAKQRICSNSQDESSHRIISLLEGLASPAHWIKRVAVRFAGKTVFVNLQDVDWIEAAENYVQLHTVQAVHLLHVAMNTIEKSLDPQVFLRIHRSIIVNTSRIKEMKPGAHGEFVLLLKSGARLHSGRTHSEKLRAFAENPF